MAEEQPVDGRLAYRLPVATAERNLYRMSRLWMVLAVAIGGAVGALLRWAIAATVQRRFYAEGFPTGTMAVNLIGCFFIGLCYVLLMQQRTSYPLLRHGVMVGLLGAMTTFSTYCLESFSLIEEQRYIAAAGNLFISMAAGMVAVFVGIVLGRLVLGN